MILLLVDGKFSKVGDFVIACKLYLIIKIRRTIVEEQVQWVLTYVQGFLADIWKENVLEDLEIDVLSFEIIETFLKEIKEFGGGENELRKMIELKKIEQGQQTINKYIQMFKRAARGSKYKGRLLVEEFKRVIDRKIRRMMVEAKFPPKVSTNISRE